VPTLLASFTRGKLDGRANGRSGAGSTYGKQRARSFTRPTLDGRERSERTGIDVKTRPCCSLGERGLTRDRTVLPRGYEVLLGSRLLRERLVSKRALGQRSGPCFSWMDDVLEGRGRSRSRVATCLPVYQVVFLLAAVAAAPGSRRRADRRKPTD
jgi:hypothetical protein